VRIHEPGTPWMRFADTDEVARARVPPSLRATSMAGMLSYPAAWCRTRDERFRVEGT